MWYESPTTQNAIYKCQIIFFLPSICTNNVRSSFFTYALLYNADAAAAAPDAGSHHVEVCENKIQEKRVRESEEGGGGGEEEEEFQYGEEEDECQNKYISRSEWVRAS